MLDNINKKILESTAYKKFEAVLFSAFSYVHNDMFGGIFKKIDEKFLKFIFVGILNTLFSYFVYAILITVGFMANIALFFQYILGVLWNFKTTGCIVFKNNNNRLIFKFITSYIFTFFLNSFLLNILIRHLNDYISQAILILPISIISFLILKFWVFK